MHQAVKIIECPRDAMQGIHEFIPTEQKILYLNSLLQCGFDTLDFGSFVSPKAIPQMIDSASVLEGLTLNGTQTKLLAIIANEKGANRACDFEQIHFLGYPFSISEEFQRRNTNASIEDSLFRLENINTIANTNGKKVVIYISMGFGNPYNESWDPEIVFNWVNRLHKSFDIDIFSISDTIGCAKDKEVSYLFNNLIPAIENVEFGDHMHVLKENASKIISSAYNAGCRRFDGAIKGYGGCPMAEDKLTGNMPTEVMLSWFNENKINSGIDLEKFNESLSMSSSIF